MLFPSTIQPELLRAEEERMNQVVTERPQSSEHERVLDWRFDAFERAGFNPVAALALASTNVDHHIAAKLLASGCAHETALRILL